MQSDTAVGNFTLILFLLQHAVWAVVLIREAYCILYIQAKKIFIMQDYGLVSIITPTWACADFIAETIRSIQAQSYQNWELLIQDDCSKDNTLEIVKPYMEADKRIKYECNP